MAVHSVAIGCMPIECMAVWLTRVRPRAHITVGVVQYHMGIRTSKPERIDTDSAYAILARWPDDIFDRDFDLPVIEWYLGIRVFEMKRGGDYALLEYVDALDKAGQA